MLNLCLYDDLAELSRQNLRESVAINHNFERNTIPLKDTSHWQLRYERSLVPQGYSFVSAAAGDTCRKGLRSFVSDAYCWRFGFCLRPRTEVGMGRDRKVSFVLTLGPRDFFFPPKMCTHYVWRGRWAGEFSLACVVSIWQTRRKE